MGGKKTRCPARAGADAAGRVRAGPLAAAIALAVAAPGCSPEGMARRALSGMVEQIRAVYLADEDPELIQEAMPFTLKTTEALLAGSPRDPELLLAACSGFTQYALAFVQPEPALAEPGGYQEAEQRRERARHLYLRARDYCVRRIELAHPGIGERLRVAPEVAVRALGPADVPALVWTGMAWGGAISVGVDQPALVADFPAVRALLRRALELDEDHAQGAIHEALILVEGVPEAMGGSPARARQHFRRAVEIQRGTSAAPYVALATAVALPEQDRAEFTRLLEQALAIDPDAAPQIRLINGVAQRRARALLSRVDVLFPPPEPPKEGAALNGPERGGRR